MAIAWDPSYETGEPHVDEQHRHLFEMVAGLEKLREAANRVKVVAALAQLKIYVVTHFGYEEKCMNRYRCPLASRNKAAHDTFRNAVQAFSDRLDREGPSPEFVDELAATVNAWLVEHICKTDVALKPCIRRDGPCIPAAS